MRRGSMFWGVVLLVVGGLLLMANFGILQVNVWRALWPLFLILLGVWVLIGVTTGRRGVETEHISVPLKGESAQIKIKHGVGPAWLTGAAEPGTLMSGTFAGLEYRTSGENGIQRLHMEMGNLDPMFWFPGVGSLEWRFSLAKDVPLELDVDGGAGMLHLDLHDYNVKHLDMDGGVGQMTVIMPAGARTTSADIDAGVGEMIIDIPEGVAARIHATSGLGALNINKSRFPMTGENTYESAGYAEAANKLDLKVEGGVGAIRIR